MHGPDGKDRRGQIWGKLVPYGLTDLGFGNGKPDPWRAGANENTVFAVSNDVNIEGKRLPAGRYGLLHDRRAGGMDADLLEGFQRLGQFLLRGRQRRVARQGQSRRSTNTASG